MVTVRLFGTLRLDSGLRAFETEAESVRALYPLVLREIRRVRPDSAVTEKTLRACLVAVNGVRSTPRARLIDGDTVCFFSSAAGG